MNLTEPLGKVRRFFPEKEAIVCGGKRWTYRAFCDRIDQFSLSLVRLGLRKDDKVAILHPNCHYFLEAYYGITQIGAVSVPLNYRLSSKEIAFILQDAESRILVADPMFAKVIDPIRGEIQGTEKII